MDNLPVGEEEGITDATIADGAWAWVEDADGNEERLSTEAAAQ